MHKLIMSYQPWYCICMDVVRLALVPTQENVPTFLKLERKFWKVFKFCIRESLNRTEKSMCNFFQALIKCDYLMQHWFFALHKYKFHCDVMLCHTSLHTEKGREFDNTFKLHSLTVPMHSNRTFVCTFTKLLNSRLCNVNKFKYLLYP